MLPIHFLLISTLGATLLAILSLLVLLGWTKHQKPVRIRVRARREQALFPPESDDTRPANAGFDKRVSTRGPPVPTPPLQADQSRRLQTTDPSDA
jgi:hypothetical protein